MAYRPPLILIDTTEMGWMRDAWWLGLPVMVELRWRAYPLPRWLAISFHHFSPLVYPWYTRG